MPGDSYFSQGRQVEEKYFKEKERELIERLRQKAAKEAARRDLAEAVGVSDEAILQALEEMGYTRDAVKVLHLFPLVAVAWADGQISDQERVRILDAAQAWGVTGGSPAHQKLMEWLQARPNEVYTQRALQIIRDIMQFRTADHQQDYRDRMKELCEKVAEASGGFLGLGSRISTEERAILTRVADELAAGHKAAAEKLLAES